MKSFFLVCLLALASSPALAAPQGWGGLVAAASDGWCSGPDEEFPQDGPGIPAHCAVSLASDVEGGWRGWAGVYGDRGPDGGFHPSSVRVYLIRKVAEVGVNPIEEVVSLTFGLDGSLTEGLRYRPAPASESEAACAGLWRCDRYLLRDGRRVFVAYSREALTPAQAEALAGEAARLRRFRP